MVVGRVGEKLVDSALSRIGTKHNHTEWDKYEYGSGCDIVISELGVYIEIKNLRGDYKVNDTFVMNHIISRYPSDAKLKILCVSNKGAFTKSQLLLLRYYGIKIIEWGEQVYRYNSKCERALIKQLRFLVPVSDIPVLLYSLYYYVSICDKPLSMVDCWYYLGSIGKSRYKNSEYMIDNVS